MHSTVHAYGPIGKRTVSSLKWCDHHYRVHYDMLTRDSFTPIFSELLG